jgi:hypothetical protein
MNHKRTIIALAVIMMAVVPMGLIMSDDSDAEMRIGDVWNSGFTNTSDGTLFVVLRSTEGIDREITVRVTEDGNELARGTFNVLAGTELTAELRFRLSSVGSHEVTITCEPANLFPSPPGSDVIFNSATNTINVTESLWSKPSTYGAIIVVAILVVIAVFLRMRSAPTTKPDTTFTELEKQQKESRGDVVEDKPKASVTERRKYQKSESPKPEAKAPAPPEEKKVSSFTELEKQKSEKKEAPAKKDKPSEEPKKLKYVSSRRK